MPDRFINHVMVCWPSDRKEIALLEQVGQVTEKFVPTIEHSLSTCDGCEQGIWVGNPQLSLIRSGLLKARKLCLRCAAAVQSTLKLTPKEVDVGITVRDAQRRR